MSNLLDRYDRLSQFRFRGVTYDVRLTGSIAVAQGVVCDTYEFDGDKSRDLGIIKIEPGCSTPRQLVLDGDYTVEGHVAGAGTLLVELPGGCANNYPVQEHSVGNEPFDLIVRRGEIMQWTATELGPLVASEVCYPPYADGRFLNLD